jgi:general secretion pathway protein G
MNAVKPPVPPPPPPPPQQAYAAEPSPPPVQPAKKKSTIWVVVGVGCLFGFFVLAIIAAIAIPNLLNAVQRGKQKRTMADMRAIATACEAYAVDKRAYPDASTIEELAPLLEPEYIKKLPRIDAWNQPIIYASNSTEESQDGPDVYIILSTGKDASMDFEEIESYPFPNSTTSFNNDIVFSNGEFIQFPEGSQY